MVFCWCRAASIWCSWRCLCQRLALRMPGGVGEAGGVAAAAAASSSLRMPGYEWGWSLMRHMQESAESSGRLGGQQESDYGVF